MLGVCLLTSEGFGSDEGQFAFISCNLAAADLVAL